MQEITQLEYIIRVLVAFLLGSVIGFERTFSQHPAGLRTHMLVSIAACVTMIVNNQLVVQYSGFANVDPGRMGSYIISGIGFIGAGTIIKHKFSVSGLTTASSIFTCAVIGLACGTGLYTIAIFTTMVVFLTLFVLNKLEKVWNKESTDNE